MPEQTTENQVPTLEEVQTEFEAWRNAGNRRRPIPERLWQLAVELSPRYRVSKISRTLRLNYHGLKNRIVNADDERPVVGKEPPAPEKPAFMELGFLASSPASRCECTIETKSIDGREMKIGLRGERCPDVLEICRIFWRNDR
jgi:hypothetical protein